MNEAIQPLDLLFETSWEVCNKVGGIYTVLSTKAKTLQKQYKDKVIFVGPDVWTAETPSPYFVESATLLKDWRKSLQLPDGVTVRVGRWNVPGRPVAILVGFKGMFALNDQLFGQMWELYHVDSLHAYGDYFEACAFSHAAALVIESLYNHLGKPASTIAHFDEWTTGMGLLLVKHLLPEVATIFTTHATSIGRSICGNGKPLYDQLHNYNGDQMARELNMEAKHSLEKTAAHQADCFTTVSEVTARECEQLLGIRPQVVTPNGFEPNFVPPKTKRPRCRMAARDRILTVASAMLGRQLPDDTFIMATSGRCEYRNKGIDVFLDAVSRLRDANPGRETLALVLVPAWSGDARFDVRLAIEKHEGHVGDPVVTHNLFNADSDPILNRIHQLGFGKDTSGSVNVIYVPCYLNGEDGIFDLTYYDLLIGLDLTVFPSYYEPWGYTPLESIAFGIPTVTTSLSGFGQWIIQASQSGFEQSGVVVLGRNDSNYVEVVDGIVNAVRFLLVCDPKEMERIHQAAFNVASLASWSHFINYYQQAFAIALQSAKRRNAKADAPTH